jgi:phenylacetate-CoA ligase
VGGVSATRSARIAGSARVAAVAPLQRWVPMAPASLIARLRDRRVRAAIAHAHAHVPYYRETMRRLGLRPCDIRSADDLARLPVIEREQLQSDPEYFASAGGPRAGWVTLQSGGSTGRPITVFRDLASVFTANIHAQRQRSLVARQVQRFRFREAVITPPSSSGGAIADAFRRSSLLSPALRTEKLVLSLFEEPARHVEALERFRPHVVAGYGSYIEALFAHFEATGRPRHLPSVVTYAADPLSDSGRALITDVLGICILSTYQSIESGMIGFECTEHAGFHRNEDFCPVRIVDADGEAVPAGQSGDVVISDLTNRATMLLNYRLGDLAGTRPDCTCGIRLPMLSFLEGRTVEWVMDAEGRRAPPQAVKALLRRETEVRRYQVINRAPGRFDVALVVAPACDAEATRGRLEQAFAAQFGAGTATTVRFVDRLPRTEGGKVRGVIVELAKPSVPQG